MSADLRARELDDSAESAYGDGMAPPQLLTEEEFLDCLRAQVHELGSQVAAARQWKISAAYLSDVLAGRRIPGAKILEAVGARRTVSYSYTVRAKRGPGKPPPPPSRRPRAVAPIP
jgi:hypothetical protein